MWLIVIAKLKVKLSCFNYNIVKNEYLITKQYKLEVKAGHA